MRYPIKIVPYDPDWPLAYERERDRIARVLGDRVVRYEHMGSTSVAGLDAKPIIDIAAAVRNLRDAPELFPALSSLGYEPIEQYSPDRYDLWHQPGTEHPTHILHLMQVGTDAWQRPLIFRDELRSDSRLRDEYSALKSKIAEQAGDDIRSYGQQKTDFINRIVEMALARKG